MGIETERKFLLKNADWRTAAGPGVRLIQGYLPTGGAPSVRIRISGGGKAYLTLKGAAHGISRSEFEYEVPVEDAGEMLREFCGSRVVEKIRYKVPFGKSVWEVDEYLGANAGLFTAELEFASGDDNEDFAEPPWLGEEVTGDRRYSNGALSVSPYSEWYEQSGK